MTLLLPVTRPWAREEVCEAIGRSDIPRGEVILILDAPGCEEWIGSLEALGFAVKVHKTGNPDPPADRKARRARHRAMRKLSQTLAPDGPLLCLEDDTIVPPDVYARLSAIGPNATGVQVGRHGVPEPGIKGAKARRGVEAITACGHYCLFTTGEAYKAAKIIAASGAIDAHHTSQMSPLVVDWDCICGHLTENGVVMLPATPKQPQATRERTWCLGVSVTLDGIDYPKGTRHPESVLRRMYAAGLIRDARFAPGLADEAMQITEPVGRKPPKLIVDADLTLTCTTGRRLHYFRRAMDSFLTSCADKGRICRWLVSDDGSSDEDLAEMARLYPFLEIHRMEREGQAASLNWLFAQVETEWFIHIEDDWEFRVQGELLEKLMDVVATEPQAKNVVLRQWEPLEPELLKTTPAGTRYVIHRFDPHVPRTQRATSDAFWYGWSLNPGLQHTETVRSLGAFDETARATSRWWDRPQAVKYKDMGLIRASLYLDGGPDGNSYAVHIGGDEAEDSLYGIRRAECRDATGCKDHPMKCERGCERD